MTLTAEDIVQSSWRHEVHSHWHEWLEDVLGPTTIQTSINIGTTTTAFSVKGGLARFLQVGAVLRGPEDNGAEYMQITAIVGDTITVTRGFEGITVATATAGDSISIITDLALDGPYV